MKMKVTMDSTMRIVSILTVRLVFSWSLIMLNIPAARLSTISPSRMAMMILTMSIMWLMYTNPPSVLDRQWLSI